MCTADTSVVKKKHERNPMTQEQERRQKNAKDMEKWEGKSIVHHRLDVKKVFNVFIFYRKFFFNVIF